MRLRSFLHLACVLAVGISSATAADPKADSWPQWGGPNRDGKSLATGLKQEWPEGGPAVAWKMDAAGMGYSSLAVADGRGYSLGASDGKNFAFCLDTSNGKEVWRTEIGAAVPDEAYNTGWGAGPRSTPTIAGDRVVVLDDAGNCCCLNKEDGKIVWKVNLISDLGGTMPKWGFSESPLVDGNRVVVCPGGKNFLSALDLKSGEVVLKSTGFEEAPHYASVLKHAVDGLEMYTTACGKGLVSFAVDDGRLLWTNSYTGASVATIPTPIVTGNMVYHTADYGTGCVLVKLSRDGKNIKAEEVWANKNQQNHHGGVVLVEDHIYGYKKGGGWVAQSLENGEVTYQGRIKGESGASVAFADGRLYVYGESTGNCYLVEPNPKDWVLKGELALPEKTKLDRRKGFIWSHPVIAEGKLFVRDLDLIYAFDIKK